MRLFVAVWPPTDVMRVVASAVGELDSRRLRAVRPERWHVTLRFLGEVGEPYDVVHALRAAAGTLPPLATATLGPETDRFGDRVLHIPAGGLGELAGWATAATASMGVPPDLEPFRGHLTLARARGRGVDLRPFCGRSVQASWTVGEVTLAASVPGPGGGAYVVLERLGLGGRT
jgi:2'-5' RNA ligase